MKTKMQQTSLFAYENILETLPNKQRAVLNQIIIIGIINDREIAERLGWAINCVTGRRNTLVKNKLVILYDKKIDTVTGHLAIRWTGNEKVLIPDSLVLN